MASNPGSLDCPWSRLVVAALRSIANVARGRRLRRRGAGLAASPWLFLGVGVNVHVIIGK